MAKLIVGEFELVDHGIDGSQYFQGCGTAFTSYNHVATGHGDTPAEALDDLLEMIAQHAVPNGKPTTIFRDGQSFVNGEAYDDFSMDGLEERIREEIGDVNLEKPSAYQKMLEANGFDGEFEFDEDDPDRRDFDSDEAFQTALAEWEQRGDEAEEKWEQEKEEIGGECDNYYRISIRWNVKE